MKNKVLFLIFILFVLLLTGCNEEQKSECSVFFDYGEGNNLVEEKVLIGESVKEPSEIEKEGYEFLGWFSEDYIFEFTSKIYSDIILVAKWERLSYEVSFDSDGSTVISKQLIEGDQFAKEPIQKLFKKGYLFKGWYKVENNVLTEQFDFSTPITENVCLKAKWEETLDYTKIFTDKMEEYFKTIDFQNFSLIKSDEGINSISWKSSHKEIIDNNGKINRPYKETVVTLTATINTIDGFDETVTFDVSIPGYKLEKATNIASTYVFRNFNKIKDELFDICDIVYCAFGKITAQGEITGSTFFSNVEKYIIPRAKEKGVYVILVLSPSSEWTTAMDPKNNLVDTVVNNAMQKVKQYGFDGIDIDWECPKVGEETWFTTLAKKLNASLKRSNPSYLLSAAITGGKWQVDRYDLKNSIGYLDYVNMMTYGMEQNSRHYQNALYKSSSTSVSGSIDESVPIFNSYGVKNSQILVGLAFYGIKQKLENSKWVKEGAVLYDNLVSNYLNNSDYVVTFDEVAGVPYIMNLDKTIFISYDNEKSIQGKCAYVKEKKLGGVMAWESGCDLNNILLKEVQKEFKK